MTFLKYTIGIGTLGVIGVICCWLRLPIFACLALVLILAIAFLFVHFPFWLRALFGSFTGIAVYYAVFIFCVQILAMQYSDTPGKGTSPREAFGDRCGEYLAATMIPIGAGFGFLITFVILNIYKRLLKRRPKLEPAIGLVGAIAIILTPTRFVSRFDISNIPVQKLSSSGIYPTCIQLRHLSYVAARSSDSDRQFVCRSVPTGFPCYFVPAAVLDVWNVGSINTIIYLARNQN